RGKVRRFRQGASALRRGGRAHGERQSGQTSDRAGARVRGAKRALSVEPARRQFDEVRAIDCRAVGCADRRERRVFCCQILKTLIIATVRLPTLAFAQQLPPRQPGQWCPVGWMASGSYCVPGSDKGPAAIPKNGWCPAGWRESGSYRIR